MNRSLSAEIKVGIFVTLGCATLMFTILLLGGGSFFSSMNRYYVTFDQVEGIVEGAPVKIMGVRVGKVEEILFNDKSAEVKILFNVNSKYATAIHEDSVVGIQTQGVLGDRYLVVNPGNSSSPVAKSYSILHSEATKNLKDYLSNAEQVLDSLNATLKNMEIILGNFNKENRSDIFFKNLSSAASNFNDATNPKKIQDFHSSMKHMDSILSKIDRGNGTIGALINDPTLYDDLKALLGGANRNKVLKYFVKKSVEDSREEAQKEEKKK